LPTCFGLFFLSPLLRFFSRVCSINPCRLVDPSPSLLGWLLFAFLRLYAQRCSGPVCFFAVLGCPIFSTVATLTLVLTILGSPPLVFLFHGPFFLSSCSSPGGRIFKSKFYPALCILSGFYLSARPFATPFFLSFLSFSFFPLLSLGPVPWRTCAILGFWVILHGKLISSCVFFFFFSGISNLRGSTSQCRSPRFVRFFSRLSYSPRSGLPP